MYQSVDVATPKVSSICLIGLFSFSSLMKVYYIFYQHPLRIHIKSFHEQLWNASSTLGTSSRPFSCFIYHEIRREQATPGYVIDKCQMSNQLSNYCWAPFSFFLFLWKPLELKLKVYISFTSFFCLFQIVVMHRGKNYKYCKSYVTVTE